MKKRTVQIMLIIVCIIAILLTISLIPVNTVVIEDKPFLHLICVLKPWCSVGRVGVRCEVGKNTDEDNPSYMALKHWVDYRGCNASTEAYEDGRIYVNACYCTFFG